MRTRVLPIVFACLLAGCAVADRQRPASRVGEKVAACMHAAGQSAEWVAVEVPAARGALANKLAAATLSLGGSNTVDALVGLLGRTNRPPVAVFGENDELASATLVTALRRLPAGARQSTQAVCFVGDERYMEALRIAAQDTGTPLVLVTHDRIQAGGRKP